MDCFFCISCQTCGTKWVPWLECPKEEAHSESDAFPQRENFKPEGKRIYQIICICSYSNSYKIYFNKFEGFVCFACVVDRPSDQDDAVSSGGNADRNTRHHGAGNSAGPARNPLPEKHQRRGRNRSFPLQPAGRAHLCCVWRRHTRLWGWGTVDPPLLLGQRFRVNIIYQKWGPELVFVPCLREVSINL